MKNKLEQLFDGYFHLHPDKRDDEDFLVGLVAGLIDPRGVNDRAQDIAYILVVLGRIDSHSDKSA